MTPSARLDSTFAALADPTRRAIIARLATGEATVMELAKPVGRRMHVRQARSRDAQRRPCRIEAKRLEEANQWLERYSAFWEASLQRLDDMLVEIQAEPKTRKRRKPKA